MTDAADIIARETGCTPDQARAAVAALVESGWEAPTKPPSQPDSRLTINSGSPLVAHTDGACSGNPGPGGWAVVFSHNGVVIEEFCGGVAATTNNQMELTAIREAIRHAPTDVSLLIMTDSQNAIERLSQNWKANEPTISTICHEIDRLSALRAYRSDGQPGDIDFGYVRGHEADPLNKRANRLATRAIPQAAKGAG